MERIVLKKEIFDALSSETRLKILKKLDERRKTVTELAKELNCHKSAIHRHLQKLMEAGLIKKNEDERKWVYYSLTLTAKNILHPERVEILLLLSSIISFITGIFIFYSTRKGEGGASIMEHEETIPYAGIFFVILAFIFVLLFALSKRRSKKIKMQIHGESETSSGIHKWEEI